LSQRPPSTGGGSTARLERVVLVGVAHKGEGELMETSLAELRGLAETAGAVIAGELTQLVARFSPRTLIGEGKVGELRELAGRLRASTIIFDHELTPAQQKALELDCKAKILDRTRVILDIFAQRARTSEGRLQVELAQLSYMLPRLTGSWRNFSQQVGGIGTRGPGERKLEYERRHIQGRMLHLKKDLDRVRAGRELRRAKRVGVPMPQVALIGYTNVGKSTLLNAMTKTEAVYADDKLFATLDPTSRRVRLPEGSWAVVTDTVGFIQRLPTTLVAAFRSTLEEVRFADCLVIVTDASAPDWKRQEEAVDEVLSELDASSVPTLRVFNKSDRLSATEREDLRRGHPDRPLISAETGEGLNEALRRVQELLARRWLLRELDVPHDQGRAAALVHDCAQVLEREAVGKRMRYRLRVTAENWDRLRKMLQ
jgi:GTP-binding protein HflX